MPVSASHSRAADSTTASSTVCKSNCERLKTLSTSAVAACCSSASSRSRVRRSSWFDRSAGDLRLIGAFRAVRLIVWLRPLAGPLALRRRICRPRQKTTPKYRLEQMKATICRWAWHIAQMDGAELSVDVRFGPITAAARSRRNVRFDPETGQACAFMSPRPSSCLRPSRASVAAVRRPC
jgi:hypothetical protein